MLRCGVVPMPVVPQGIWPFSARAPATTSAAVRSPELAGVIITNCALLIMQTGARSVAR